jgi:DNA-binding protein H-NS
MDLNEMEFGVLEEVPDRHSPSIVTQPPSNKASPLHVSDFASMSVDELWKYRESIDSILAAKIASELAYLRKRLEQLNPEPFTVERVPGKGATARKRRPYPSVLPKYRNPKEPSETWSGRGKQPRWLQMELSLGKQLDDLLIK